MDILNIIILSIIQGVTEFLPISSSSHLILLPMFTEFPDQGIMFDVAWYPPLGAKEVCLAEGFSALGIS